ncbi:hypothetical protein E2P81_ATG01117 [Venturia nashicola]|nr:hypothetical protein E2P81_ATG01117 [Venturia nashicola]
MSQRPLLEAVETPKKRLCCTLDTAARVLPAQHFGDVISYLHELHLHNLTLPPDVAPHVKYQLSIDTRWRLKREKEELK